MFGSSLPGGVFGVDGANGAISGSLDGALASAGLFCCFQSTSAYNACYWGLVMMRYINSLLLTYLLTDGVGNLFRYEVSAISYTSRYKSSAEERMNGSSPRQRAVYRQRSLRIRVGGSRYPWSEAVWGRSDTATDRPAGRL